MKLNPEPWQEKLPLAPLRAGWIIFCLLLLPGVLFLCKIPEMQVPFFSVLAALPACMGNNKLLGIKPLEFSDFALVAGGYVAIILLSVLAAVPWKLFWDSLGIKYAENQDMLQMIKTGSNPLVYFGVHNNSSCGRSPFPADNLQFMAQYTSSDCIIWNIPYLFACSFLFDGDPRVADYGLGVSTGISYPGKSFDSNAAAFGRQHYGIFCKYFR